MPPYIRRAYERSRRHKARHQPSQADEQDEEHELDDEQADAQGNGENDEQPSPAWIGGKPGGGVAAGFESVTGLGPTIKVTLQRPIIQLFPNFGPAIVDTMVR